MKTQNKTLAFNKSSIIELNAEELNDINGGLTPTVIAAATASSAGCAAVGSAIAGAIVASIWA